MAKLPLEEVDSRLYQRGIERAGPYIGTTQKPTPLRCLTCGHEWEASVNSIQNGRGCPECARKRHGKARRIPVEEVDARLESSQIERAGPYAGTTHGLTPLRCQICGHEWTGRVDNVFQGKRCPKCACKHRGEVRRTSEEEVDALLKGTQIERAGPYAGTLHAPTPLRCQICGHEWEASIHGIKQGRRCPKCACNYRAERRRIPVEEIDVILTASSIERSGPYVGSKYVPTPLRCQTCGHEWKGRVEHIENGGGCPVCVRIYDPWQKSGIYLLSHPEIETHYVGISYKPSLRLEEHRERDDAVGIVARSIDEPYEYTLAEVHAALEAGWEDGSLDENEYVQNWFIENPKGMLPPGRLWFPEWDKRTQKEWHEPARVPRFVAQWVEDRMIWYLSVNHDTDCPWLAAGKVKLENKVGNAISA